MSEHKIYKCDMCNGEANSQPFYYQRHNDYQTFQLVQYVTSERTGKCERAHLCKDCSKKLAVKVAEAYKNI